MEKSKNEIVSFYGVPCVRVLKKKARCWQVQIRPSETSNDWEDIGPQFSSCQKAVDEAPYLCGF